MLMVIDDKVLKLNFKYWSLSRTSKMSYNFSTTFWQIYKKIVRHFGSSRLYDILAFWAFFELYDILEAF